MRRLQPQYWLTCTSLQGQELELGFGSRQSGLRVMLLTSLCCALCILPPQLAPVPMIHLNGRHTQASKGSLWGAGFRVKQLLGQLSGFELDQVCAWSPWLVVWPSAAPWDSPGQIPALFLAWAQDNTSHHAWVKSALWYQMVFIFL